MKWVKFESPEDIQTDAEVLVYDGCDYHIDYVDVCADSGIFYMANGTEPTHYAILAQPETKVD